ncbi:SDR family NAD(P)-dependent oxidoreductase [Paenibacillus alba]|uniref:SDR family NAD(P)-dependent oxidoreductase n=1 Tax=Paenibacillus alba TaxID=1197127 RepID=A0ABU6G5J9_9BACL|nr:SDR family NAD(P)-dependent oxidoreductase [Paenibacillus alba]MEC0229446.1 SDR family NAD(P)-dependent oxidoreductase [Paenibacillus alba]
MASIVCVTGTDRGVGLALTKLLLEAGCCVYAGSYLPANEEHERLAEKYPGKLHSFALDIGSDASVKAAAELIMKQTDGLDMLINNAGILGDIEGTIEDELDFEDMQQVFNVTALGAIRMANALFEPIMKGGKFIVNISSEAGSIGQSYRESWYGYCMAKAALNMGSSIIHNKMKKDGGRVLLIHPGWVQSYMSGTLDTSARFTADEAAAHIVNRIESCKHVILDKPLYVEAHSGNEIPW